eukprot:3080477-Lingulodinium_polyedra.AAC.1
MHAECRALPRMHKTRIARQMSRRKTHAQRRRQTTMTRDTKMHGDTHLDDAKACHRKPHEVHGVRQGQR